MGCNSPSNRENDRCPSAKSQGKSIIIVWLVCKVLCRLMLLLEWGDWSETRIAYKGKGPLPILDIAFCPLRYETLCSLQCHLKLKAKAEEQWKGKWSSVREGWVRPGVYANKKHITIGPGNSVQLQSPSAHTHDQTGDVSLLMRGQLNHWVVSSLHPCVPFLDINFSLV